VDASECPVKAEIYRLAARYALRVALVSAKEIGAPFEPWLTKIITGAAGTVAETILSEAGPTDIVVTDNADMAQKLLGRAGGLFTYRGQRWTAEGPFPTLKEGGPSGRNRERFEMVLDDALKELRKTGSLLTAQGG